MTARAFPTSAFGRMRRNDTPLKDEQETQRLVVLATCDGISIRLRTICAALDIELVAVTSHHDLPLQLHHTRPMGVVSELDGRSQASCASLRSIAAYDPEMPVLVVAGMDPIVMGTIDAAEQLWGLSGVHRLMDDPSPHDLINFLFQAGRQAGTGRLMPIT